MQRFGYQLNWHALVTEGPRLQVLRRSGAIGMPWHFLRYGSARVFSGGISYSLAEIAISMNQVEIGESMWSSIILRNLMVKVRRGILRKRVVTDLTQLTIASNECFDYDISHVLHIHAYSVQQYDRLIKPVWHEIAICDNSSCYTPGAFILFSHFCPPISDISA